MNKNNLITPLILTGISLAFAVVSFLVWLSRGNNAKLIQRKLRLGALLLGITAVSSGCPPAVTCYDPIQPEENIFINDSCLISGMVQSSVHVTKEITGQVVNRMSEEFSFCISDHLNQVILADSLTPLDGQWNQYTESYKLIISDSLAAGTYNLKLFNTKKENQTYPNRSYTLTVKP